MADPITAATIAAAVNPPNPPGSPPVPGTNAAATPPPAPPATPAPVPQLGKKGPQTPVETDAHIVMSNDQLNERMGRSNKALLKKFGFESEAEFKAQKAEFDKLRTAEKERQQAEMSELEKTQAELATIKTQQAEQAEAFAQQQFESTVNGHCARLGISNTEYAQFDVEQAASQLPEGEQLDVEAHLKGRLQLEQYKAAFGIVEPAPQQVEAPASTTPMSPHLAPPASPPPGGPPAAQKTVMDMSPQEFATYQQTVHGVTPGA